MWRRPSGGPSLATAALLAVLAAIANAAQALVSKELTARLPARQLIGVLYVANALILLPLAPFVSWRWSAEIVALHLVSVALMAVTAISVWDLLDAGAASATTTATALAPLPAAVLTVLLVPGAFQPIQAVAALLVSVGVLAALGGAFAGLGRRGAWLRVAGAACGGAGLTVATRLLGDLGVGVVETYVARTSLAALVFIPLFPPRDIPLNAAPRLMGRALVVTTYFVLLILAAQRGSPLVVQAVLATTPLLVVAVESWRSRRPPELRVIVAASLVLLGVAISFAPVPVVD